MSPGPKIRSDCHLAQSYPTILNVVTDAARTSTRRMFFGNSRIMLSLRIIGWKRIQTCVQIRDSNGCAQESTRKHTIKPHATKYQRLAQLPDKSYAVIYSENSRHTERLGDGFKIFRLSRNVYAFCFSRKMFQGCEKIYPSKIVIELRERMEYLA
ncbi:hypothetical protein BDN70DRAFT_885986 [Pholiota conissans]|uniref:Uncharacterized protein n=1 Tax=Pholiota conissans TaxID=109636 RepID=A0A9P6CV82_9AGAR|nr:hypothetical protein BDN70DRAFT_885986 [Pholiota conissans]